VKFSLFANDVLVLSIFIIILFFFFSFFFTLFFTSGRNNNSNDRKSRWGPLATESGSHPLKS
jgi:hypothetical protein